VDVSICKFDGIKQVTGPSHVFLLIQSIIMLDHIIIIIFIKLGSLVTE